MGRRRKNVPLRVLLNNSKVGDLVREPGGAIQFTYDGGWLAHRRAMPISLSLPLRKEPYTGSGVIAVFENLLPDSEPLRKQVAARVGAEATDAYGLLEKIGHDCVGALQFLPIDDEREYDTSKIAGEEISDSDIATLLKGLAQAPLGLKPDEAFRISVAGAQEKTALLRYEGKWLKPYGSTPTSHLFKVAMGKLSNGIDMSHSIQNEYYCLKLMAAFGLPVCQAEIHNFAGTEALVVERFDRRWTRDGRLLRLPQEDCCQALSVPPHRKYQSEGGPGLAEILMLLKGGDLPDVDQHAFLKAQILFWLIGATDGHAKNFSIFLGPAGRFKMTPLYDVMSVEPSLASHQITRQQMKMAMCVGNRREYRVDMIRGRHFVQTTERSGLPAAIAEKALEEVGRLAESALTQLDATFPRGLFAQLHETVSSGLRSRLGWLSE